MGENLKVKNSELIKLLRNAIPRKHTADYRRGIKDEWKADVMHKFGFSTTIKHRVSTPKQLFEEFINYVCYCEETIFTKTYRDKDGEETNVQDYKLHIPNILGFSAFSGLPINYLKSLMNGSRDVAYVDEEKINTMNFKELLALERMVANGEIAWPEQNYSHVMKHIMTCFESWFVNVSIVKNDEYLGISQEGVRFLLKNHFGYKEKIEETITSDITQTIIVNDLVNIKSDINVNSKLINQKNEELINKIEVQERTNAVEVVDAKDIDLGFLLGEK